MAKLPEPFHLYEHYPGKLTEAATKQIVVECWKAGVPVPPAVMERLVGWLEKDIAKYQLNHPNFQEQFDNAFEKEWWMLQAHKEIQETPRRHREPIYEKWAEQFGIENPVVAEKLTKRDVGKLSFVKWEKFRKRYNDWRKARKENQNEKKKNRVL